MALSCQAGGCSTVTCAPHGARAVFVRPDTTRDKHIVHLGSFEAHGDQYGSRIEHVTTVLQDHVMLKQRHNLFCI